MRSRSTTAYIAIGATSALLKGKPRGRPRPPERARGRRGDLIRHIENILQEAA
jgi:hypothetical protein